MEPTTATVRTPVTFYPVDREHQLHYVTVAAKDSSSAAAVEKKRPNTSMIFILDRSGSMGSSVERIVMPACQQLLSAIRPDHASVVFFNTEAVSFDNVTADTIIYSTKSHAFASGGTQIEAGVEEAITLAVKRAESASKKGEELFVHFVLMTDGQNFTYGSQPFDRTMDIERERLSLWKNTTTYLSAINIGSEADTRCAMQAHQALTNVVSAASNPLSCAAYAADIPSIVKKMASESGAFASSSSANNSIRVSIRLLSDELSSTVGFLSSPGATPSQTFRAVSNGTSSCFFVGDVMKSIIAVECDYDLIISKEDCASSPVACASLMESLPAMIRDLRIAQVTRSSGIDIRRGIIFVEAAITALLRQTSSIAGIAAAKTARSRVKLMNQGINAFREQLSEVKNSHAVANASSSEQAKFIVGVDTMKFKKAIAKRAGLDSTAEERVKEILDSISTPLYRETLPVEHALPQSFICQLTAREFHNQISEEIDAVAASNPTEYDTIYGFGMLGHPIRVVRSSASEIDPMAIKVAYVSPTGQYVGTCESVCALESGYEIKDLAGQPVPDVLVTCDPCDPSPYVRYIHSKLHEAYMGVVFARNPSVAISGQHTALLTMSLVRLLSQLGDGGDRCTETVARLVLEIIYTLSYRVKHSDFWSGMAKRLLAVDDPRVHLTSAQGDNVTNITMPLVALLMLGEEHREAVADADRMKRVLHALICQTVANNVAARNKSLGPNALSSDTDVLFDFAIRMRISDASVPEVQPDDVPEPADLHFDDSYDAELVSSKAEHAFNLSGACSVKNVVRMWALARSFILGQSFSERYASMRASPDATISAFRDELQEAVASGNHLPQTFETVGILEDGERDFDGYRMAVSLQAELNPTTAQRRPDDSGKHPLAEIITAQARSDYIRSVAVEARKRLYFKALAGKIERNRAKAEEETRRLRAEKEAQIVAEWHKNHVGLPNVFSLKDIIEHDEEHDGDPWQPSEGPNGRFTGMLADRCCFPTCPDYLKRLGKDGLWHHLAPGNCIRGFHATCRDIHHEKVKPEHSAELVIDVMEKRGIAWNNRHPRSEMEEMVESVMKQFTEKGM